ncbi:class I SAM-dependent methyltransferase [Alkalihalobacillus pseudalcaliphilus]|uniref:class I SAM-dependent methyltransferase n=1 Tax=Alkalihalobacillus pseudalcaliphilus TaxID=79884 RepID=UPI00064DFF5C|nr:class I SAM-dependent methyltransferase [Alkalihalobacillus pseudalcaliphilus]KMK75813.1 SAM-dependent methyltransferase [Alkalihalobacillus pseudalcaliphilus]
MKQNKYDDDDFFRLYKEMPRSQFGLEAAGEWHILKQLIPSLENKHVLDLGCGFGWHCQYALEQGASQVIGVDISQKMLEQAQSLVKDKRLTYKQQSIEEIDFPNECFDVIISSLAIHYVKDLKALVQKAMKMLTDGGVFVVSVEHPIFTALPNQDWYYNEDGEKLHWPVDRYQDEGVRETSFLTNNVIKYHRTLSTYINTLTAVGFVIKEIQESKPTLEAMEHDKEMKDEMRRPMFLLIKAIK